MACRAIISLCRVQGRACRRTTAGGAACSRTLVVKTSRARSLHDQCPGLANACRTCERAAPGAGEGLQPDHGKRRSVRQHYRPLEWWRSEKKVYTRQYRSACPTLLPGADAVEESCR